MFQAYILASGYPLEGVIVQKSNLHAIHGPVAKNNVISNHGNGKKIQIPALLYLSLNPLAKGNLLCHVISSGSALAPVEWIKKDIVLSLFVLKNKNLIML